MDWTARLEDACPIRWMERVYGALAPNRYILFASTPLETRKHLRRRLFTSEDELLGEVLSFLYRNHRNVYPTADIAEAIHGKAAPSSKSGVDRAIKLLINQGFVASRNAYHPGSIESLSKQETVFYITQKGLVYYESTEGTSPDVPGVRL